VIKHTEFFSVEILLFWLPSRVVGPEVGPGRKWQGLGPALSIASAATGLDWTTVTTDKLADIAPIVKKISRISALEIWQP